MKWIIKNLPLFLILFWAFQNFLAHAVECQEYRAELQNVTKKEGDLLPMNSEGRPLTNAKGRVQSYAELKDVYDRALHDLHILKSMQQMKTWYQATHRSSSGDGEFSVQELATIQQAGRQMQGMMGIIDSYRQGELKSADLPTIEFTAEERTTMATRYDELAKLAVNGELSNEDIMPFLQAKPSVQLVAATRRAFENFIKSVATVKDGSNGASRLDYYWDYMQDGAATAGQLRTEETLIQDHLRVLDAAAPAEREELRKNFFIKFQKFVANLNLADEGMSETITALQNFDDETSDQVLINHALTARSLEEKYNIVRENRLRELRRDANAVLSRYCQAPEDYDFATFECKHYRTDVIDKTDAHIAMKKAAQKYITARDKEQNMPSFRDRDLNDPSARATALDDISQSLFGLIGPYFAEKFAALPDEIKDEGGVCHQDAIQNLTGKELQKKVAECIFAVDPSGQQIAQQIAALKKRIASLVERINVVQASPDAKTFKAAIHLLSNLLANHCEGYNTEDWQGPRCIPDYGDGADLPLTTLVDSSSRILGFYDPDGEKEKSRNEYRDELKKFCSAFPNEMPSTCRTQITRKKEREHFKAHVQTWGPNWNKRRYDAKSSWWAKGFKAAVPAAVNVGLNWWNFNSGYNDWIKSDEAEEWYLKTKQNYFDYYSFHNILYPKWFFMSQQVAAGQSASGFEF